MTGEEGEEGGGKRGRGRDVSLLRVLSREAIISLMYGMICSIMRFTNTDPQPLTT